MNTEEATKIVEELKNDRTRVTTDEQLALINLLAFVRHIKRETITYKVEREFNMSELDNPDKCIEDMYKSIVDKLLKDNAGEFEACELFDGVKRVKVSFTIDVLKKGGTQNGTIKNLF